MNPILENEKLEDIKDYTTARKRIRKANRVLVPIKDTNYFVEVTKSSIMSSIKSVTQDRNHNLIITDMGVPVEWKYDKDKEIVYVTHGL